MEELLYYKSHSSVKLQEMCYIPLHIFKKQKVLYWSNQTHVSNIAARYEVPTISGNTLSKVCI